MYLSTILMLLIVVTLIAVDYRRRALRCVTSPVTALFAYLLLYVVSFEIFMKGGGVILIQSHYSEIFLENASVATCVFVAGCAAGYTLNLLVVNTDSRREPSHSYLHYRVKWPRVLIAVSVTSAIYMYLSGQLRVGFNPIDNQVEQVNIGYILQAIDLAVPAIVMLYFIDRVRSRRSLITIGLVLIFGFLYMMAGSRYRIFCLLLGIGAVWFLTNPRIYKILLMLGAVLVMLPAIGIMATVRNYRAGVNLDMLNGATFMDMISRGFNEASTTIALGAVVETVPRTIDHVGLDPVWVALAQPIPRILWPGKPTPDYLLAVPLSMGPGAESFGLALPLSGELYLMGGYFVVFLGAALIFFLLERGYSLALARSDVPMAAAIFLFVPTLFSRGYLAQALTSFVFLVLPVVVIGRHGAKSRYRKMAATQGSR